MNKNTPFEAFFLKISFWTTWFTDGSKQKKQHCSWIHWNMHQCFTKNCVLDHPQSLVTIFSIFSLTYRHIFKAYVFVLSKTFSRAKEDFLQRFMKWFDECNSTGNAASESWKKYKTLTFATAYDTDVINDSNICIGFPNSPPKSRRKIQSRRAPWGFEEITTEPTPVIDHVTADKLDFIEPLLTWLDEVCHYEM